MLWEKNRVLEYDLGKSDSQTFSLEKGYLMVNDVSYFTKPKYIYRKIDQCSSNGQWPCFEMANHLSRKKISTVR